RRDQAISAPAGHASAFALLPRFAFLPRFAIPLLGFFGGGNRFLQSSSTVSGVVARAAAGAGFGAEVRGEALRPFALRPLLAVGAAADRRSVRAALTVVEVRSWMSFWTVASSTRLLRQVPESSSCQNTSPSPWA